MNTSRSVILIAVVAAVTIALRFLPFIVFRGKKTPDIILYLGKVLPYAIMGMLVVYCFKDTVVLAFPFGLPEFIAGTTVVIAHLIKRNTLLSIISGTVVYMLLIQFVFH